MTASGSDLVEVVEADEPPTSPGVLAACARTPASVLMPRKYDYRPAEVLFGTQHPLGVVVNRPSV
ncbi:MAG TPA: hypothetical protein VFB83_05205 [Propionibacteriaceae bacterium]|nr:hypothetical protein [Propionibacteriaceae bacterium]